MEGISFSYDVNGILLGIDKSQRGLLKRFTRTQAVNFQHLPASERELICAIGDLRELSSDDPQQLRVSETGIWISHDVASRLDGRSAGDLGLPKPVDLTFTTDAVGVVGSSNFKLSYQWTRNGQRQLPARVGAVLETGQGPRLIPHWMLKAIEVADSLADQSDEASHWEALARFRQTLEPGLQLSRSDAGARMSMTDFLSNLEVRLADAFSISPTADVSDFEVVPFSRERLEQAGEARDGEIDESGGELNGEELRAFQRRVRDRGALPAYRIKPGSYLIIDRSAMPALKAMAAKQRAARDERKEFIQNPRPAITEAVEADLGQRGRLARLIHEVAWRVVADVA